MYNALKSLKIIVLFFFFTFIDQFLKYIIRTNGGFYICNQNIAFGIVIPNGIFWAFWIVIIGLLMGALYKKYSTFFGFSILLILSGAVSNIIDRLYFGCVVDFIDLKFWPVFNLADIYITIGSIILLVNLFKKGTK